MVIGILLLLLGGACQGSFGIGYKKYTPLKWEAFWGFYSALFFIVPLIWTIINAPNFLTVLGNVFEENSISVIAPILCGMAWGITAVGFGKAVDKIGMSLVYGLSMGVSAVVGSSAPLIMKVVNSGGANGEEIVSAPALALLLVGLAVTLVGIAIITKAGLIKDKNSAEAQTSSKTKSAMKIGLILALFSGLGSSAMNIGFDFSNDIETAASALDVSTVGISAIKWLLVLFGGSISSCCYCAVAMTKNHSWKSFKEKGVPKRLLVLVLTSIVWFTALAAYGIATFYLGETGTVVGWIVFNALALLISNAWGLKMGEWRGQKEAKKVLLIGNAVLILAWAAIGFMQIF